MRIVSLPLNVVSDGNMPIAQFVLIGPFQISDSDLPSMDPRSSKDWPDVGLTTNYLSHFAVVEAVRNPSEAIAAINHISASDATLVHEVRSTDAETGQLDFEKLLGRKPAQGAGPRTWSSDFSTVYAIADIFSQTDCTRALKYRADDIAKIWLNGVSLDAGAEIIPVRLRKGHNILVVKVYNRIHDWLLTASLLTSNQVLQQFVSDADPRLLTHSVLAVGQKTAQLNPLVELAFPKPIRFAVHNSGGKNLSVTAQQGTLSLPQCDGLYTLIVSSGSTQVEENFACVDSVPRLEQEFTRRWSELPYMEASTLLSGDAVLRRFQHLLKPSNEKFQDIRWQQKIVELIRQFTVIESVPAVRGMRDVRGLQFRGFRSEIDKSIQNYAVYVPPQYSRSPKGTPIVVVMPAVTTPNRPFLESIMAADLDRNPYIVPARMNGFITVFPNGRSGYSLGHPLGQADVLEVLHNLQRDYSLDLSRLYLVGVCSGGLEALSFAVRFPHSVAAVALIDPLYRRGWAAIEATSDNTIASDKTMDYWREQVSPIGQCGRLRDTDIFITHARNHHAPFSDSLEFIRRCGAENVKPRFIPTDSIAPDSELQAYAFFRDLAAKPSRLPKASILRASVKPSLSLDLPRDASGRVKETSPLVQDVFSSAFRVSCADNPHSSDGVQEIAVARTIAREWKALYFADLPIHCSGKIPLNDRLNEILILPHRCMDVKLAAQCALRKPWEPLLLSPETKAKNIGMIFEADLSPRKTRHAVVIVLPDHSTEIPWERLWVQGTFSWSIWTVNGKNASVLKAGFRTKDGALVDASTLPVIPTAASTIEDTQ